MRQVTILLLISLAVLAEKKSQHHTYPWTEYCQQSVYCQMIKGDLTRFNGKFDSGPYNKAKELVDKYLSSKAGIDFDKVNSILRTYGVTRDHPYQTSQSQINKLNNKLEKYHVSLAFDETDASEIRNLDMDELLHTGAINFKYADECLQQLNNCTAELTTTIETTPNLQAAKDCPWESIPYSILRCQSLALWPESITNYLSIFQKTCNYIPSCENFEGLEQVDNKILPLDWENRKASQVEVKLGRGIGLNAHEDWARELRKEIAENPQKYINSSLASPTANYTEWLTCSENKHYMYEFSIIKTVHGLAGIAVKCLDVFNNETASPHYDLRTNITKYSIVMSPPISCTNEVYPSLLTGFNLVRLKSGTWWYYLHTLTGRCRNALEYTVPEVEDEDDLNIEPLNCPVGEALTGIRINLQKPVRRDYERMYDLQGYCNDVLLNCTDDGKIELVKIFEYDNSPACDCDESVVTFDDKYGYEASTPGFPYKAYVISNGLNETFSRLVNETEYETFEPMKKRPVTVTFNESYIYRIYKKALICKNYIYYLNNTELKTVQQLSGDACKPRLTQMYLQNTTTQDKTVYNVLVNVDYTTFNNFTTDEEFDAIVEKLQENFERNQIDIDGKFFKKSALKNITVEKPTKFITQTVGICTLGKETYKVHTDKLHSHPQPNCEVKDGKFVCFDCKNAKDQFIEIGSLTNFDDPDGLDLYYELHIGLDWFGRPREFRLPPGTNPGFLDELRINVPDPSPVTGVNGWGNVNRTNYMLGSYKRTMKLHLAFLRGITIYQVVGVCDKWQYYTGFQFYRLYDVNGICLGGFSSDGVEFDCDKEIGVLDQMNEWLEYIKMGNNSWV